MLVTAQISQAGHHEDGKILAKRQPDASMTVTSVDLGHEKCGSDRWWYPKLGCYYFWCSKKYAWRRSLCFKMNTYWGSVILSLSSSRGLRAAYYCLRLFYHTRNTWTAGVPFSEVQGRGAGLCLLPPKSVTTKDIFTRLVSQSNEQRKSRPNLSLAWNVPIKNILLNVNLH